MTCGYSCCSAEIDRLKVEIRRANENIEGWKLAYNKVMADNIKLTRENTELKKDLELYKNIKADTKIAKLTLKVAELQRRNDAQAKTIAIAQEERKKLQEMTECEVYGQPCSKRILDHFNSVWNKWRADRDRAIDAELNFTELTASRNKYLSDFKDSEFVIRHQNNTIKNLIGINNENVDKLEDYAEAIRIYQGTTRGNLAWITALTEENEKLRAGPSSQTIADYSKKIFDLEATIGNLRDEIYNVQKQSERKDEQIEFWHKKHQGLVSDVKDVLAK